MSTVKISTSAQPVTVAEAKLHSRIDQDLEDSLIEMWIAAATSVCEQATNRAIAMATYKVVLDEFPEAIRLVWPPVVSVESVRYIDSAGVVQTMDPAGYRLDSHSEPGWLLPVDAWPDTGNYANAVEVNFTAGYGAAAPEEIKACVMLHVTSWARNREIASEKLMHVLPYAMGQLDRWRVY